MVAEPVTCPVTMPANIVATDVLPELQTPPIEASLRVVVAPVQTVVAPVIGAGKGLIVTVA